VDEITSIDSSEAERKDILSQIPQKDPFRFIDNLLELSEDHAVSEYRFKLDEYFYRGHFPNHPVTPGVILVETMAQTGLVALGLYLLRKKNFHSQITTLFTDCKVDFHKVVEPGARVTVRARKVFWRRRKLSSQVEIYLDNNEVAASGTISGFGVIL